MAFPGVKFHLALGGFWVSVVEGQVKRACLESRQAARECSCPGGLRQLAAPFRASVSSSVAWVSSGWKEVELSLA